MHDVDGAEAALDSGVQILAQRLSSSGGLLERGMARSDRAIQSLDGHGSQKLLLVREVSVQRGDPNFGTVGHGVSGGLAADLENQFDRPVDDRLPIPPSVSAHRNTRDHFSFQGMKRSIFLHF